jgi:FKBP-type peptidyl-prolyl cis-trans isomerase
MRKLLALILVAGVGCAAEVGKPTVTGSGVRIQDISEGSGAAAQARDFVQIHYIGTTSNGKEFVNSRMANAPLIFVVGDGDPKGLDEGVAGMKVGGKRTISVPARLAYGNTGRPGIPPHAELVFEVELLKIIHMKTEDQAEGSGDTARTGDTVDVHYTGRLADGTVFDSSIKRGEPLRFQLGARKVIIGWEKGVVGMRPGGKRRLVIPSDLAYGAQGRPPVIPPNAELTFDVELVRIAKR